MTPALRTRTSARDARVTLVSLAPVSDGSEALDAPTESESNARTRRAVSRSSPTKAEAAGPSTPPRSNKRPRKASVARVKAEDGLSDSNEDVKPAKGTKASPSPRKPTPTKLRAALTDAHPEPPRWRETYEIIRKQREGIVAAVDLMGCDAIAGMKDEAQTIPEKDRRLASLISLMLSSQTKDPVTHEATMNLRRNLQGGLCLEGILAASDSEIQACINKVGFWRRKTDYIRRTAEILRDKFDGDVPKTIEDLLILPGVGPKMGFLCLQAAWGIQVGIGVDTHVHRITNRLGWHRKPTTEAEETRVNLESWLPAELHSHVNIMLVGLGQTICLPVGPRCDLCHLGQMEDSPCPSKRKVLVKQAKVKKQEDAADNALAAGEVGQVADLAVEVEETETKTIADIKAETIEGPTVASTSRSEEPKAKKSRFFAPKQEPTDLAW